jgi:hypothetical protein
MRCMEKTTSPTEHLRQQAAKAMEPCATCGHAPSYREVAALSGVGHVTLWRFLSGRGATSDTLDAIAAWLAKGKRRTA